MTPALPRLSQPLHVRIDEEGHTLLWSPRRMAYVQVGGDDLHLLGAIASGASLEESLAVIGLEPWSAEEASAYLARFQDCGVLERSAPRAEPVAWQLVGAVVEGCVVAAGAIADAARQVRARLQAHRDRQLVKAQSRRAEPLDPRCDRTPSWSIPAQRPAAVVRPARGPFRKAGASVLVNTTVYPLT